MNSRLFDQPISAMAKMANQLVPTRDRRRQTRALGAAFVAALLLTTLPGVPRANAQAAPPSNGFIVMLRDDANADAVAREHARQFNFIISHVYGHALKGYVGVMETAVADRIKSDPRVQSISENLSFPGPIHRPVAALARRVDLQQAPLGVQRIGASADGTNQTLVNEGAGVGVAVIDTGILLNHPDLTPVNDGYNCVDSQLSANDDEGHGTHVAGTIAARENSFGVVGVAPAANLYAVKVLDKSGNGNWGDVICGVDWVTANAATKGIKVANMSLGGPLLPKFAPAGPSDAKCNNAENDPVHKAICNSVKAGVTYVVAAGNGDLAHNPLDASTTMPAAYDEVIAVSAWSDTNGTSNATGPFYECKYHDIVVSTEFDEKWASFTNYGPAVAIAAPGVGILSTYNDGGYAYECGTSMAAPHVSGAAALLLKKYPNLTPANVKLVLRWAASPLPHVNGHTENLLNLSAFGF